MASVALMRLAGSSSSMRLNSASAPGARCFLLTTTGCACVLLLLPPKAVASARLCSASRSRSCWYLALGMDATLGGGVGGGQWGARQASSLRVHLEPNFRQPTRGR